jgi:hypothetical protein
MYVKLLSFTTGKPVLVATVRTEGDSFAVEMAGDGEVPADIRRELTRAKRQNPDPETFLRALPSIYSGSYFRAQLVK